ncbi:MAG: ABC-type transport auxiliary lipoprotein family protein [Burkholderiales bacterium]|nr:ABC-type transport auxiliary lipoprotein family protein [Burkholderiales bacterium]
MTRVLRRRALGALLAVALAGCAGGGGPHNPGRVYDLGTESPPARIPALELREVRALQPYDGVAMHYRLAYQDGAEVAAFAHSRWAAPPSELVRRQIARAMRPGTPHCTLEIDVHEFSQVFQSKEGSTALLELVATLGAPGARDQTRVLRISEADAGSNAAQGASALRRAVARAVAELGEWIEGLAACRG